MTYSHRPKIEKPGLWWRFVRWLGWNMAYGGDRLRRFLRKRGRAIRERGYKTGEWRFMTERELHEENHRLMY